MVRMHAQAALRGSTFQVASRAGGWVRRSVSTRPRAFLAPGRTTSPQWVGSRGLILGRAGLRVAVTPLRWKPPSLSARREYSLSPQAVVTPVPQKTGSNLSLSSQDPFNPTTHQFLGAGCLNVICWSSVSYHQAAFCIVEDDSLC